MITATTDYSGRQVDLEFLQTIEKPVGQTAVTKSVALKQPKMVAGLQKLIQRYVVLLLTRLGTVYLAPDQGSRFLDRILRGGGRSGGYIEQTFAFANSDVIDQMRSEDNLEDTYGPTSDDERIDTAVLLDYSVDFATSTLSLRIFLESVAGQSVTYVVPVTVPRS
jgi:hypothetical protein